MNSIRKYSRRSLILIFFFLMLLMAGTYYAICFGINEIDRRVLALMGSDATLNELKMMASDMSNLLYDIQFYVMPVLMLTFCVIGLLIWFFLRRSVVRLFKTSSLKDRKRPDMDKSEKISEKRDRKHRDQRLFLYLVSILQREGRLLDFLFEDLNNYDDAQIGATARNVHENCRKVIQKNLAPKPVIDRNEGEQLTVDQGFDSGSILLTGNVVGDPPFHGILRHKGWQSRKLDLPVLSEVGNSNMIAPAEVDVQQKNAR